ncbi:hypothetical protein MMC20_001077 [Loxospora ochrophaea]|nr:hypothetical protein [Loxospora ochrophaea]
MEEREDIAAISRDCQSGLITLLAAATSEDCQARHIVHPRDVQQVRDRFDQWAGNLGALQPFKSPRSLEHRLREVPLVRDSIFSVLIDLRSSVQAATDIALGKLQNRIANALVTGPDTDLSEYDISSSESDSSFSSSDERRAVNPTSEIQELIFATKAGLDSLFKASIFIRKFAPKERRLRAAETKPFDNRADIMYVNDRYPLLTDKNAALVARLGEANARRRQYFKYRRDHNERLSMVAAEGDLDTKKGQLELNVKRAGLAKTVLTVETKPSLFAETEATAFVVDKAAQAQTLELPSAPQAMSIVSFATSVAENSDEELPFPPLPAEAEDGSPFLCPYCLQYQQVKHEGSEHRWRKHVLQDLEPYICTFSSCGLDTFQSQHTWFEHELLVHRNQWVCSECFTNFRSPDDLKSHISQGHPAIASDWQLSAILDQSKRSVSSIQPTECPFCDGNWAEVDTSLEPSEEILVVDLDQFRRHLGHHLQQVALFSLPRLLQGHDQSLVSHDVGGFQDQDTISRGPRWIRDDAGYGWRIVSRRRPTFIALAFFLMKHRAYERPGTLTGTNSPAFAYLGLGQHMQTRVLETRKLRLGAEHPDTLKSMADLAITYSNECRYTEAEKLQMQVLETRKRMLGTEHPDTLKSMDNLAITYSNQGRYADAEILRTQVLETRKQVLGTEHPDTLESMADLASTYSSQGRMTYLSWTYRGQLRLKEAVELGMQVLDTRKRVLGAEHPDTLNSMNDLALTYLDQERLKEAEELSRLASIYRRQGRLKEAEELETQLSDIRARVETEPPPKPDSASLKA